MDLGFGQNNQVVGNLAAQAIVQASKAQEKVLEQEIDRYDALLDDDEALDRLRSQRMEQMKKEHENRMEWKAQGHGEYIELASGQDARDVARDFFEASKHSERLVVHFYRPTTPFCDVFHQHLQKLAHTHLETKFVKINVEGCDNARGASGGGASYLVEKLGIYVMPTLLIVKNRKVEHHVRGFDELGASPDFSTAALGFVLSQYGALFPTEEERNPPDLEADGVNRVRIVKGKKSQQQSLEEEDF